MTTNWYSVCLEGDENILELAVTVIAQFCEYTKKHWIIHFKGKFIVYELYLDKNFNVL